MTTSVVWIEPDEPFYYHMLTGGNCVGFEKTIFTCRVSEEDLNEIKRKLLCSNELDGSDCCLTLASETLEDIAGNPIEPIFEGCGFNPTRYIPDSTPPSIVSFDVFDLNIGQIKITFNETINASTVDPTAITLQSFYHHSFSGFPLSGGDVVSGDSTQLVLNLTKSDLDELKRRGDICTSISMCWVSFTTQLLKDVAENDVVPVSSNHAEFVEVFVTDKTPPNLLNYDFDLDAATLTLTFDEPVDVSSINPRAITFHPSRDNLETMVQLTGGTSSSNISLTITLDLLEEDVNSIKVLPELVSNGNDTFISVGGTLVADTSGVFNNPIPVSEALPVGSYTADMTPPTITQFSLDLNEDQLKLTFDEPVNASTFDFEKITILSQTNRRTLIGGEIDDFEGVFGVLTITINLTWPDIDYLKLANDLATGVSDTLLIYETATVYDMSDIPSSRLLASAALRPALFVRDERHASLMSFTLDMNMGELLLTFNDVVLVQSLYTRALTLQNTSDIGESFVTMMHQGSTNSSSGHYITIKLDIRDLNRLKVDRNLATSLENTFLSMRSEAFKDSYGRNILAVISHASLQATRFIPDRVSPYLHMFSLDLTEEILLLVFDEVIESDSVRPQELIIQADQDLNTTSFYQLQNSSSSVGDSTMIVVYLSPVDLNEIKRLVDLAVDKQSTFLSFSSLLAEDMNGNSVVPISNSSGRNVEMFEGDSVSPELVSFDLDLTLEQLVLSFSETVDATTLNVSGITLQGAEQRGSHYTLTGGLWEFENSTRITIELTTEDLNELKKLEDVATEIGNTYISLTEDTIADMTGNNVVPINPDDGRMADGYFNDTIRPVLDGFSLNLSSELITLSFSETIRSDSINITYFILQSHSNSTAIGVSTHQLTGGTVLSDNGPVVDVMLLTSDLNEIKRDLNLAVSNDTTFLAVFEGGAYDMADLPMMGVSMQKSLLVEEFTEDTVRPMLVNFTLDLNEGYIVLTFSETVNSNSFTSSEVTLQNSPARGGPGTSLQLSVRSTVSIENSTEIIVDLDEDTLNELKRLTRLASDPENTFISITQDLVEDMNSNPVVEIPSSVALDVQAYVYDGIPPVLEGFDLSLNSSTLVLRFSETVMSSSLNVEGLLLQSSMTNTTYSWRLTQDVSTTNSDDGTSIVVNIGDTDLNNLKRIRQLATSVNNTYLSVTMGTIMDMNGNEVEEINSTEAINVSDFVEDHIRPQLVNFTLDMNTGVLVLTFSETVQVETVNLTAYTLHPMQGEVSMSHTLMPGGGPLFSDVMSVDDDTIVVVAVGDYDLNKIKEFYRLATLQENTYLSVTQSGVRDMNNHLLVPVTPAEALSVEMYSPDVEGPVLVSFSIDLSSEVLSLTFDETINIDSFDVTSLTLHGSASSLDRGIRLTGYRTISRSNSTVINITLSLDDLHRIKLDTSVAVSNETAYLSNDPHVVLDMAHIPNMAANLTRQVDLYISDSVQPQLVNFTVDLNTGVLVFTFDEPINTSTINFPSITLLSSPLPLNDTNSTSDSGIPEYYTLLGGFTNDTNGLVVAVYLTVDDLNVIKTMEELLISRESSYISVTYEFLADMNENMIEELIPEEPLQAAFFYNDTTRPMLTNFTLNMNEGTIILTFPETVDASMLMCAGITLQNRRFVIGNMDMHMLMCGAMVAMENDITVFVKITPEDLNILKRRGIGVSKATSWLVLDNSTIVDMFDLPVVPITNGFALNVGVYIPDMTPPTLTNYSLNLNSSTLILTFSETVSVDGFNVTAITLQDTRTGRNVLSHFTLTDDSRLVDSSNHHILTVQIGTNDFNDIQRISELANSHRTSFLSHTSDLVRDVFGNEVIPINTSSALPTHDYILDMIPPELFAFDLDLDNRTITLYFTETVNSSSLDVTQLTLRGAPDNTSDVYTLQDSLSLSMDDTVIVIEIDVDDFNEIKARLQLATSSNNTYLTWTGGLIEDMSGNPVVDRRIESALPVSEYYQDVSPPRLMYFDLDMDGVTLTLYFSETVNVSSINFTSITLQALDSSPSPQYSLTTGDVLGDDGPTVVISVRREDEDEIKRMTLLATNKSDTFIAIASSLVEDMDGNEIESIPRSEAMMVRYYTPDSTQPELVFFDLDLNGDVLLLEFSETVEAISLQIPSLTLQNVEEIGNGSVSQTLTDSMVVPTDSPILVVELSRFDRDTIRRLTELAVDNNTTFISALRGAVLDMRGLPLNPIYNYSALPVRNYTEDLVRPKFENFTLNLSSEVLMVSFSETVDISTIDITEIVLSNGADTNFTLTGGIILNSDHSAVVRVSLTTPDLNVIKNITVLVVDQLTTYIMFSENLLKDMNGNLVLPEGDPTRVDHFVPDDVPPTLSSFDLDLTRGALTLTFSETVNTDTLDASQITLQSMPGNLSDVEYHTFTTRPSPGSHTVSPNGTVVVVWVSNDDLNRIKQLEELATSNNTTFVSITMLTVQDMNENYINEMPPTAAIPVSTYTEDTVSPKLISFSLDLEESAIHLFFDETVNITSLSEVGLTLQSTNNSAEVSLPITSRSSSSTSSPNITVDINSYELNLLKSNTKLGKYPNNTFVTVSSLYIRDMNNRPVQGVVPLDALQASNVYLDVTPPTLLEFDFDLDKGTITLNFSESVDIHSLNSQELTLLSETSNYTLTGLAREPMYNDQQTVVTVTLLNSDLNVIKSYPGLVTMRSDTILFLTSAFIRDNCGNEIVPTNDTRVTTFTNDTTCPELKTYNHTYDQDNGTLCLCFSETVNASTFDVTSVTVLSHSEMYTLLDGVVQTENSHVICVDLSERDQNKLKHFPDLATPTVTTYVVLSAGGILDMAGNEYCNNTAPQVVEVGEDVAPPFIIGYCFDLDGCVLTITFSEPATTDGINVGFDQTGISFTNPLIPTGAQPRMVTLSGGPDGVDVLEELNIINFTLTAHDCNSLKSLDYLATERADTYITVTSDSATDFAGNPLVNISTVEPLIANRVKPDVTPPSLLYFTLDLDLGTLTLTFSEYVNVTTINLPSITFVNSTTSAPEQYTLTGGDAELDLLTSIIVYLSSNDSNTIKSITNLATRKLDTYLSIRSSLVMDSSGLPVNEIDIGNPKNVRTITFDETEPKLVEFSLNLTTEVLSLTFDETVDTNSLMQSRFQLQSDELGMGPDPVTLKFGTVLGDEYSPIVDILLSKENLDDLKRNPLLATSTNNTCLSFQDGAIADITHPPRPNMIQANVSCTEDFGEDTVPPQLENFIVDLNASYVVLQFDEPVNDSTFDVTQITFLSSPVAMDGDLVHTLTGGNFTTDDLIVYTVTITGDDLNEIKRKSLLLRSPDSTYISITSDLVDDMNGNSNVPIPSMMGMLVDDEIRPVLESFDMDMNTGTLTLYFSETVNASTLQISGITLQQSRTSTPASSHSLTMGVVQNKDNSPIIIVTMSNDDLNVLKSREIGLTNSTLHIAIDNTTILDIVGRSVLPRISRLTTLPVDGYIPDSTPPQLTGFSLDLTDETITLSFNETIDAGSIRFNQFTINDGSGSSDPRLFYTLTDGRDLSDSDLPKVTFKLTTEDLNEIKKREDLATSSANTYISITENSSSDVFGNRVVPDVVGPGVFVPDTISPEFVGFQLDMDSGVFTLTFSETVNSTSLDTTSLTLFNDDTAANQSYTLRLPYIDVTDPSNVFNFTMNNDDVNAIKSFIMLAVDESTTYLFIDTNGILDQNDNPLVMAVTLPVDVGGYIEDDTPPILLNFTVDMNTGLMTLNFDETIESTSVQPVQFALRHNATLPADYDLETQHELTGGQRSGVDSTQITIKFTEDDLNVIKRKRVCTRQLRVRDCYLVYVTNAVQDMVGNEIQGCRSLTPTPGV